MKRALSLSLLALLITTLIVGLFPSPTQAHFLPHGSTFLGTVTVDGRPVPDGTVISPWVPGVDPEIMADWKTETYTYQGNSHFICVVGEDNPDTEEKDGAYMEDDVQFYIELGVVNLLADQSVKYGIQLVHGVALTASYMPAPQLVSPENGAKVAAIAVTFTWSVYWPSVTPPGVTYQLQVDTAANFSSPAVDVEGLTDTQYTADFPLADGVGIYYWRVQAKDSGVWHSDWSAVWFFTAPGIGYQQLVKGWNLITYLGSTLPTETALASLGDDLTVIWGRDNQQQKWYGYIPGGGFANDLLELEQYQPYWVHVKKDTVLKYIIDC